MENLMLKEIARLITVNAGIRFREQDYPRLNEILWRRSKQQGLSSLEDYYACLVQELESFTRSHTRLCQGQPAPSSALEWHSLLAMLTVNETYFFRDKNQFNLLAQTILPELIARKQHTAARPSLRLWSAGCSTGEELYSIAMALEDLKFPWREWNTLLIGTDISTAALATARQGIYGDWSFRQTDPHLRQRYFQIQHRSLQVREDIRRRVTFQYGNLVKDEFPSAQALLQNIDLIICRNVFIYFDPAAIAHTLAKFSQTLLPEGYLITGHTELYGQDLSHFHLKAFPESMVYQRQAPPGAIQKTEPPFNVSRPPVPVSLPSAAGPAQSARAIALVPSSQIPDTSQVETTGKAAIAAELAAAQASLQRKAYAAAIRQAESILARHPQQLEAYIFLAKAHANTGNYATAKDRCQRILELQPLNLEVHYLLAQIAEEEGDRDRAKTHLRRIIYLDPQEFRAYLDLASLYHQEGHPEQVIKMQRLALKTLNLLPDTLTTDSDTGATVLDWRQHLEKQLST